MLMTLDKMQEQVNATGGNLDLWRTQVGDAGCAELAKLTGLTTLRLGSTKVGDAGIAALRAALPGCYIEA